MANARGCAGIELKNCFHSLESTAPRSAEFAVGKPNV